MKFIKNRICMLLTVILTAVMTFSPVTAMEAHAAVSTRISFSDPQAKAGEEFTVTMKITALSGGNLGSTKVSLKYDTAYLQFLGGDHTSDGSAGIVLVTGDSGMGTTEYAFSLKFKALAQGTTALEINDYELYDVDSKAATLDKKGSSAITIAQGETGASDATLKSLKISPGTLTPAFDPTVTEYTAVVAETIEKVTVSAPTTDADAKVVISGNSGLVLGENTVTCKVTAQDGSVNTYTITVTRQEGLSEADATEAVSSSSDKAVVNGIEYDVAATFDDSILPDGYNAQEVEYHGGKVKAAVEAERGITLIYLIAADGSGDFFVYDAQADSWSPWAQLNVSQKSFTIVPLGEGTEVPEGFVDSTIELNGKKIHGWVWGADTEQKYCIVYAMNSEGDKNFYRYDMKEKTVQRYFSDPVAQTENDNPEYTELVEKYNSLIKDYNLRGYFLTGLGVVAAILLVALIAIMVMDSKKSAPSPAKKSGRSGSARDDRRSGSAGLGSASGAARSSRTASGSSKTSRNGVSGGVSARSSRYMADDIDGGEDYDYGSGDRKTSSSIISPKKNAARRRIERIEEQTDDIDLSPTEALPPVTAVRRHKEIMDAEEHYLRGGEIEDTYSGADAQTGKASYSANDGTRTYTPSRHTEEDEDAQAFALMAQLSGSAEKQAQADLAQHVGESAREIDEEDDFSNVSL